MRTPLLYASVFLLSGCSVVAAASGSKDPDYSKVKVGADRETIRSEFGDPITVAPQGKGGSLETYNYKLGDPPAPGRAVLNGVLDLVTICLWEYIAFPLEISRSGNSYQAVVSYNGAGKATEVQPKIEAGKESPDGK